PAWQLRLALGICKHYDCATYVQRPHLEKTTQEEVRMVGRPDDVEAARYMFAWLSMEVQRLAKSTPVDDFARYMNTEKEWRDSFKHGAVEGIINAMHESKQ